MGLGIAKGWIISAVFSLKSLKKKTWLLNTTFPQSKIRWEKFSTKNFKNCSVIFTFSTTFWIYSCQNYKNTLKLLIFNLCIIVQVGLSRYSRVVCSTRKSLIWFIILLICLWRKNIWRFLKQSWSFLNDIRINFYNKISKES